MAQHALRAIISGNYYNVSSAHVHKFTMLRFADYQSTRRENLRIARMAREMAQTSALTQALHYFKQINLRLRKTPQARAVYSDIMLRCFRRLNLWDNAKA